MLHRRKIAAALLVLFVLAALTVLRPPPGIGPLERDFEAYYAAGATVNAGRDPYGRAIWDAERRIPGVDATHDEILPYVGPAAALPLWSLLARLPYRVALAIWTVVLLGALAAIVGTAVRLAWVSVGPWRIVLATGTAAASAPVIASLALGQAALLAAGGFALATIAYRSRHVAAAVAATLIAAVQPNLALPLVARIRTRRDLACAATAAALFGLLTFAVGGGIGSFPAYLQRLGAHRSAERAIAIQHTPEAVIAAFGAAPELAAAAAAILALATAAAAVLVVARERLNATTATLVCAALLPLGAPFFHEADFALEVPALLALALRARDRARALAAIAAVMILVDWFGLAQRAGAQGQILALGLAVLTGFAGLSPVRSRRPDLVGAVAFVLIALAALPIARAHPAPTWPDALPLGFRVATDDASAAWAAEQRAAGLARQDAGWGMLRAIPLVGCGLLSAALVLDFRRRRSALRSAVDLDRRLARLDARPLVAPR